LADNLSETMTDGLKERVAKQMGSTSERRDRTLAYLRPVDASTLILLDRSGKEPSVLMGKRNPKLKFMPGKFVFPGGRIDPCDRSMTSFGALSPHVEQQLSIQTTRMTAQRCRALAMAAIRETFEETGLMIGTHVPEAPALKAAGPWAPFADHGVYPTPDALTFLARAITPPGRPRRFDTRFFVAERSAVAHEVKIDLTDESELTELAWLPLSKVETLDLPAITHVILHDLADRLKGGLEHKARVPFYFERHGRFLRELM
jgi:8-oxo-dGTP pyrophosphatase MutT (NUDIX family)